MNQPGWVGDWFRPYMEVVCACRMLSLQRENHCEQSGQGDFAQEKESFWA